MHEAVPRAAPYKCILESPNPCENIQHRAYIKFFYGIYYVTKAAIPVLREQGSGHIIQISSAGRRYQSAKFAVEGFSEVSQPRNRPVAPFGVHVTLIEPRAMRTGWVGSSMNIPEISEPYRPTIGALAQMMRTFDGQQSGEPGKVGQVVVNLTQNDNPPLRLMMGADAYNS